MGSGYQPDGQHRNPSDALPTLHEFNSPHSSPYSLLPTPCSHQSYVYSSTINYIVWMY
ncbi:MAG: hypothetical protein F6K49_36005 [Moorea sp. SIO3I6]|nr:hypothetical protein [Moorena sp. SIO3I6]